jgi:hypothetical protein
MLNDILKVLTDFGYLGILIIFTSMLIHKIVSAKIELWLLEKKKKNNNTSVDFDDLKNHSFFVNSQYRLMVEIPKLQFNTQQPVRQQMWRDLLYGSIKVMHDSLFDNIDSSMNEWTPEMWANKMTLLMGEINIKFEGESIKNGIPLKAIEVFTRWNTDVMSIIHEYIIALSNSRVYYSNISRMNTLLFLLNLKLVTMIGDSEKTLSEINGELSGLVYKNLQVE